MPRGVEGHEGARVESRGARARGRNRVVCKSRRLPGSTPSGTRPSTLDLRPSTLNPRPFRDRSANLDTLKPASAGELDAMEAALRGLDHFHHWKIARRHGQRCESDADGKIPDWTVR